MHQHPHTIQAVGTPNAKYPDIAAAMASTEMRAVSRLVRLSGLEAMAAPLAEYEIDAKLAASKAPLEPRERIALKIALSRVGLMKSK